MKRCKEIFDKCWNFFIKHSDLIGYVLLAAFFVYMHLEIYQRLDISMESDMCSELVLAKLLASEKRFITTNWYYSTEIRMLNTNVIFMPLFLISDNWHFVRMTGMMILDLILLSGYFYLAKQINLKHIPWFGFLVIGAISKDYYKVVLLDSCYVPHIAISFFSLGLIISIFKEESRRKRIIKSVILALLSFAAGLEGMRLVAIMYLPIVVTAFVFCFLKELDQLKEGKFDFKDKSFSFVPISMLTLFFSFLGALINAKALRPLGYSFQSGGTEIYYQDFSFTRLQEVINGWLYALGYQSDGLYAFIPIQIIIKPLFIVFFIIFLWSFIDMLNKKYDDEEHFLSLFFVVAALILSALFVFTDTWYRNRYLLPVSVFSTFIIGIFLSRFRIAWQKWMMIFTVVAFMMVNTRFQIRYRANTNPYAVMVKVKDVLLDNECYNGYAIDHWNGHNILTELSDGKIETWRFRDDGTIDRIAPWLQSKLHNTQKPQGKTYLLVLKQELEDELIHFNQDVTKYKYYEDDDRILYIFNSYEQVKEITE